MLRRIIAGLMLASVATAPVGAQTMLDNFLKKVIKPKGEGQTAAAPRGAVASISPAQTATIDRMLTAPLQDPQIGAARTEAAPLIRTLLATGSCAKASDAWNALNRDALEPQTYRSNQSTELVAMDNLQYHDRNACLDVVRLTEWTRPANNALRFRAYYIASDSGEAKQQTFELQKVNGRWLLRDIGVALT